MDAEKLTTFFSFTFFIQRFFKIHNPFIFPFLFKKDGRVASEDKDENIKSFQKQFWLDKLTWVERKTSKDASVW